MKILRALMGNCVLLLLSSNAFAQFTYSTNGSAITLTSYTGSAGTVTISNFVTSIGNYAFDGAYFVTNVIIDTNVTNIGQAAFLGCGLGSVVFPNSVVSIGTNAFGNCSHLVNVTIPNGVITLGPLAFAFCSGMTNATIGNGLTNIATGAFESCGKLVTVSIGLGVTNIGSNAFESCAGLAGVYFLSGPPAADSTVFSGDTATVYHLSGSTGWGSSFAGQLAASFPVKYTTNGNSLSNGITVTGYTGSGGGVTIPGFVTSIQSNAFANVTTLTSITFSDGVTNIGEEAFEACSNLKSVAIGSTLVSIGDYAFQNCNVLTGFLVSSQNPNYSSVNGVLFNKGGSVLLQYPQAIHGSYTISNSVTSIGDYAFQNCSFLTTLAIPNSVTNIGTLAFNFCTNLAGIAIPPGVTSIGFGAFADCSALATVTLPNGVASIGQIAFAYCTQLSSINIPRTVTNIQEQAFWNCTALTSAYFNGNAPGMDSTAFESDPTTIYYLPGATSWSSPFAGRPAVLWNPSISTTNGSFGIQNNQFGFTITGTNNFTIVVEVCTNLMDPTWIPLHTITLDKGAYYFTDPQWTNYSGRYYSLTFP